MKNMTNFRCPFTVKSVLEYLETDGDGKLESPELLVVNSKV